MSPIPVEIYEQYNGFFDYISVEAIVTIIFGGAATLFGAYIGARKAGEKSVEAVNNQIKNAEEEKRRDIVDKQKKYSIYLNSQLDIINNEAKGIDYFIGLYDHPSNPYNVHPLEEAQLKVSRIKDIINNLYSLGPENITKENYVRLGNLNAKIYHIERNFRGYLATEGDEQITFFNKVRNLANEIQKL